MPKSIENHLKDLAQIVDKLGMPIDQKIILPVAALRIHNFTTTGSCQGHLDRATGGPYITICSSEAARYEQKMNQTVLGSAEFRVYRNELQEKNLKERARLQELLDSFYVDNSSECKLFIQNIGPGTSSLHCAGYEKAQQLRSDDRNSWLHSAQTEFGSFASWLFERKN